MARTPSQCWAFGIAMVGVQLSLTTTRADDVMFRYDGNVMPVVAGFTQGNPCDPPCSESVEDGRFVFRWPTPGDFASYGKFLATPETPPPPPTLWAEGRFRSNHPVGRSTGCDGSFLIAFRELFEVVSLYGDAAFSREGGDFVIGLDIQQFHLYRFESLDGVNYSVSVDGRKFIDGIGNTTVIVHSVKFFGRGGCVGDSIPNQKHEWDFIRYGTISSGERVVSSDPPAGFVDARTYSSLDRFTITFDSANYVYVDDITVETTCIETPIVTATRRLDNGEPDTVEIVLDRPIPFGETTRFTMTDGVATNIVEYTFAPGDANGNGKVDLFDAAVLQNCFGEIDPTGLCAVADLTHDDVISLDDFALLSALMAGP